MILAIDPSYSSTGVAVTDDIGTLLHTEKISCPGVCYKSITSNHDACATITHRIHQIIDEEYPHPEWDVIVEYPALATKSGAYLAILCGFLASELRNNCRVRSITWVPPTACDSFVSNKEHSKTYLVNYCKDNGWISKRTSHDECTAIIFSKLLIAIRQGRYKNSSFTWNRSNYKDPVYNSEGLELYGVTEDADLAGDSARGPEVSFE